MAQAGSGVAILGVGMATSLGSYPPSVCAAVRAGIARPRETSEVQVMDAETMEPIPLMAHPVPLLTEGFARVARWLRLSLRSLESLTECGAVEVAQLQGVSAIWIVTRRIDVALMDLDPEESTTEQAQALFRQRFAAALAAEANVPLPADVRVIDMGPAGLGRALEDLFAARSSQRVLVIAVDSWIDPGLLALAAEQLRLKGAGNPSGFAPGEAAVALVLEAGGPGRAGAARPLARIVAASVEREAEPPIEAPGGPALARSVKHTLSSLGSTTFTGDFFVDLTGEEWRAMQWGNCLVSLGPSVGEARTRLPAVSAGATGAASSALALCVAVESLRRGWARAPVALVVSASDNGEVACIGVTEARA